MSRPVVGAVGVGGDSGVVRLEPEEVGEVADLNQRLIILLAKRVEDKARIKELEKYRAQYAQVSCC